MITVLESVDGVRFFRDSRSSYIYASGTLNGKPYRFSTGARELNQARRIAFMTLSQWRREETRGKQA